MGEEDDLLTQMRLAAAKTGRQALLAGVETRLRTTMIGALATFEEEVGRTLWGHGLPAGRCSPEQLAWRAVWQERVRPAVLNNGNAQIRAARALAELYEVRWRGQAPAPPERGQEQEQEGGQERG